MVFLTLPYSLFLVQETCSEHMCEKEEIPPPFPSLLLLSQQQLHRR
jgi:hypothetical protein